MALMRHLFSKLQDQTQHVFIQKNAKEHTYTVFLSLFLTLNLRSLVTGRE